MRHRHGLEPGERAPGGPLFCQAPHPSRGAVCAGYIGRAARGALLVAVWQSRDEAEGCTDPHLFVLRCAGCGRQYVFELPSLAEAA